MNAIFCNNCVWKPEKFRTSASHQYSEVTGSNPVEVLNFSGFHMQLQKIAFNDKDRSLIIWFHICSSIYDVFHISFFITVHYTCEKCTPVYKSFKPITKRSNRNHVITFDRHAFENSSNAVSNAKLVFLLRILSSHFQSHELQRCHKQAGGYIFPGHLIADTELQILVCSSSN